jgi:hypothetical protein
MKQNNFLTFNPEISRIQYAKNPSTATQNHRKKRGNKYRLCSPLLTSDQLCLAAPLPDLGKVFSDQTSKNIRSLLLRKISQRVTYYSEEIFPCTNVYFNLIKKQKRHLGYRRVIWPKTMPPGNITPSGQQWVVVVVAWHPEPVLSGNAFF